MLKIRMYPLWTVNQDLHEGCSFLQQPVARAVAIRTVQLHLKVLLEVFIRLALRQIGQQVKHINLMPKHQHSYAHLNGTVRLLVVERQEHLAPLAVLHEQQHETDGRLSDRCSFDKLKAYQALVADGADHCQAKTLARDRQYRRMTRWGITPNPVTALHELCLIGTMKDSVLLVSLLRNQEVGSALLVPRLFLQGSASGTLSHVAPALEVLAHRAQHPFLQQCQGEARQVGATGFPGNKVCFALSRAALRSAEDGVGAQRYFLAKEGATPGTDVRC